MIKWIVKCICLLFVLGISGNESLAKENMLDLYARSAVLMDGDSGRILYGKEADTPLPMASTTKIMTCIIALEQANEQTICTVSENAARQPKVKLGMKAGEKYYLKDLLYSLMLESHNDTAVCIAENVAGSVEGFANLMNQKAGEIGCKNTFYITPNGLDAESGNMVHHTTAEELARVMRYCISVSEKAEEFVEITSASAWNFSDLEEQRNFQCRNHNALLYMVEGVISGKTGYTGKAGYCYVGALKKDGKFLIISLLACGWPNNRGYKWSDAKRLFRYGLETFRIYEKICTDIETESVKIINGKKESVRTGIEKKQDRKIRCLLAENEKVLMEIEQQKELKAPVERYVHVGTVTYRVGDFVLDEYRIITAEEAEKTDYLFYIVNCADFFLL